MQLQHNTQALLYCRRSPDERENDSVENQAMILREYANKNNFHVVDVYQDDEYRGMTFDRPDFIRLMSDLRKKRGNCVIVKDLSRLGRDHIQVDMFREVEFPQMGVRLIAVADNYDGANLTHSANSMAQVKGLFNEWHAAEASIKVRDVFQAKRAAGQYIAKVPLGYKRNPLDKRKLVVDEEAAGVVRHIFDLAVTGKGYEHIAKILANEKIKRPTAQAGCKPKKPYSSPYDWHYTAVRTILNNPTYLGHTVQGKYTTVSYKVKKVVKIPQEQWICVENTHEPIIAQKTWDAVQALIHKRKRSTKRGEPHIFAGLLKCSDCGYSLAKNAKGVFSCWQYKVKGKEHCTNHHITLEKLTAVVLASIRNVSEDIRQDKDGFVSRLSGIGAKQKQQKTEAARRDKDRIEKRLAEILILIQKAFEQNAGGKLPDDIYADMMEGYKAERESLTEKLEGLKVAIEDAEKESGNIQEFTELIAKYIDIQELDSAIVHELIEKIVVHQAQRIDGQRTQQIDIYYRFVGKL